MSKLDGSPAVLMRAAVTLQVNRRTVRQMRDFFVDQLGFSIGTEVGFGPSFITLDRDGQTIMLDCRRSFGLRKAGWAAYFWTDDIEVLFQEVAERGAPIKGSLVTKDYGCREFAATAPDGREIVIGEIVAS